MELPSRERLLDVAWLAAFHADHGSAAFRELLRQAAEAYDGPITAIAATLLTPPVVHRFMDHGIDVARTLSHRLLTSSWSSAPEGPVGAAFPGPWMSGAMDELYLKRGLAPPPTLAVPRLADLRLRHPLDGAWLAHCDGIWGCDVSPDGRYMLSGSRDRTIALWEMERGTLISRISADHGDVRDCLFTPDGARIVSVHADGRVIVWASGSGQRLFVADTPLPKGKVTHHWRRIALSPDAARVAIAGWNGRIEIWDLNEIDRVATLHIELPGDPLGVFLPSSTRCIAVGRGPIGSVTVWDVESRQETDRHHVEMPADYFRTAALTADERLLIAATDDQTFVWELGRRKPLGQSPGGIIGRGLALSHDGSLVATSDFDRHVRLRTLSTLAEIGHWYLPDLGCGDLACAVAFTPDNSGLLVAGWEGVIRRISLTLA